MTDVLELETRKKIYHLIVENPGVNLSKIAEILHLSAQLVDYHLLYMRHHGLITIVKEGGYKRCYIEGKVGVKDKRTLAVLRQEIPLKIVLFLLKNPYSRHRDILNYLGVSSPHFSYHLRKLVKNRIVEVSTSDEKKGYVVRNEKEIINFLIRYKPSRIAKMIEDTWVDFGPD